MTTMLHATCVAVSGHGVLLRAPSGGGKSDLALRLIDGGALLVGDDYCAFTVRDGTLVAAPQAALAGLLEVRGVGIVRLPHAAEAAVRLIVDLVPGGPVERLPESSGAMLFGVPLPAVRLDPFEASAPAKVRLAVRLATGDIGSAA
ncbi:MAG: hypothetical protein VR70_13220 [Rhodospirillaceae bacterium BRH_c57]|nr:MAG: hypothetical protein VR70_13220 [Rhodospirillaceae bacterium BRH_c57]